jgi:hypothetical protein
VRAEVALDRQVGLEGSEGRRHRLGQTTSLLVVRGLRTGPVTQPSVASGHRAIGAPSGQVPLDEPIDVSVDAPGALELVHGHRGQLLADEVEELGGVLTGARVDVDDEGAVDCGG